MTHLDNGLLRRWLDEEARGFSLTTTDRQHLAACDHCQTRLADLRQSCQAMAALFGPAPLPDHLPALARLRRREKEEREIRDWRLETQSPISNLQSLISKPERILPVTQASARRWTKPLSAVAAVIVLVAAFMLTPLGSYAQGVLNLFTPKQFVAVPVTAEQMRTLPDLSDYGTMTRGQPPSNRRVANAAEAAAATGLTLATPGYLPAGAADKVTYNVSGGTNSVFTFSAAKAEAAAKAQGKTLPAMPANIDGSTLHVTVNPAVVASYGENQLAAPAVGDAARKAAQSPEIAKRLESVGRSPDAAKSVANAVNGQSVPQVVIAQSKAPVVTSTGVTVPELLQFLLAQPGIAPEIAAAVRSIADPSSTLPIPIPVDRMNSRPVQVQGVNGLLLGDATGLGSGVVWEKGGIVYAVGGPLKDSEVLQIANSLR